MPRLKKYLVIVCAVAFTLLTVGCSSNQVAEEDVSASQSESDQMQQTQPASQSEPSTQVQQEPVTPQAWTDISANQAWQLISTDKTVQVIDLRDAYMYRNKHIVGATHIPSGELESNLDLVDKSKPVLVYDDSGRWSAKSAELLTKNGYTKVYNLTGGMASWRYGIEP